MGTFNELERREKKETFIDSLKIDTGNWFQIFSACAGKMMTIQYACSDLVVKGQDWDIDFSEGVITFGDDEYPVQFLGSESDLDETWLWGWENINEFPEEIIRLAKDTKRLGEQWNLEPLTTAEFSLDDTFNGHNLSIVVCGLSDRLCYYRGPHLGGAIFVAFSDVTDEVFAPIDFQKFSSITMQCIEEFDVDHKIFIESFLSWNGTKYEWNGNTIIAHFSQKLHIEFEWEGEYMLICSMKNE